MRPTFFTTRRPQQAVPSVQNRTWRKPDLNRRPCPRNEICRQIVCMAHPRRVVKVAKQIEREIGSLLVHDKVLQQAICPERRSGFDTYLSAVASVTEVQLTNDLQVAKVYVSVYSDDMGKAVAMQNLHRLEGYVRKHVGQAVRLRLTPEIRFIMDDSIERSVRVENLLKQMEQIRLGQAEPPPIALPDYDDEEDWADEEDVRTPGSAAGSNIDSVDLGFFAGPPPPKKGASGVPSSSGRRAAADSRGGARTAARGQPAKVGRRGAKVPPVQQDLVIDEDEGFFVDVDEDEAEEMSDAQVEEMVEFFKRQRAQEAKSRGQQ